MFNAAVALLECRRRSPVFRLLVALLVAHLLTAAAGLAGGGAALTFTVQEEAPNGTKVLPGPVPYFLNDLPDVLLSELSCSELN